MNTDQAIEILENHLYSGKMPSKAHFDALAVAVAALKRHRWIPVNERLPKDCTAVNVTWVNHDPEPYYAAIKDVPDVATAVYFRGRWYWYSADCEDILSEYGDNEVDKMADCIEVTHWMPLPEPPGGKA